MAIEIFKGLTHQPKFHHVYMVNGKNFYLPDDKTMTERLRKELNLSEGAVPVVTYKQDQQVGIPYTVGSQQFVFRHDHNSGTSFGGTGGTSLPVRAEPLNKTSA